MAKAKHQKPKPSRQAKQPLSKKRGGKQNDISELRAQLDILGLKIIQVTADGNCFFRALADQLEGDEDEHEKYRSMVVQFIKNNREMFEPFVEDEVPFDDYCRSMGEDGTWAGNMELQAASLVTHCNICVHTLNSPRLYLRNFSKHEARMIHFSYHDGEHYNSVRSKEDTCSGPARPFVLEGDEDPSEKSSQPKAATRRCREEGGKNVLHEERIKLVKAGSGCKDTRKVEKVLQQAGGNVDAAVEVLIAEQGFSDEIVDEDEFSHLVETSNDKHQDEISEKNKSKVEDKTSKLESSGSDADIIHTKKSPRPNDKKISRNKACPCGSKKKYKSCCGSAAGKSSSRFAVNQTVDYGKSRKERKQARKAASNVTSPNQSGGGVPPDVGALYI